MADEEISDLNATITDVELDVTPSTSRQANQVSKVDAIDRIELPSFWTQKAHLWFVSIEALFASRRITSDSTKYFAVIARLDQDTLSVVEDVVTKPPVTEKYPTIKQALLNHFSVSQERQFKTLISGLELGGRRPSALLAEMNRLGGNLLDATFVRTMWADRLPQHVQVALAAADSLTNDKLAQLADKIMDIQQPANYLTPITQQRTEKGNSMQDLTQLITTMCNKMNEVLARTQHHHGRDRNRSSTPRPQSRSKSRSQLCYYHQKFAAKAVKCRPPCTWTNTKPDPSGNA